MTLFKLFGIALIITWGIIIIGKIILGVYFFIKEDILHKPYKH